jgi:hypothetical protein
VILLIRDTVRRVRQAISRAIWRQVCVPLGHLTASVSLRMRDTGPRWVRGDNAGNQPWSVACKCVRGATKRPDATRLATATRGIAIRSPMWVTTNVAGEDIASSSRRTPVASARSPPPSGVVLAEVAPPMSDDSPIGSDVRFGGRGGTRTPDSCLLRTPRIPPPGDMHRTQHQLALIKTRRAARRSGKCWQVV